MASSSSSATTDGVRTHAAAPRTAHLDGGGYTSPAQQQQAGWIGKGFALPRSSSTAVGRPGAAVVLLFRIGGGGDASVSTKINIFRKLKVWNIEK